MSQRYFLTAESTYEDLRQSLNAALSYPNALGKSVFQTALYAPRDNFRRVLLAVDTDLPGYATVSAAIAPLLDSDAMEEIDEATYLAALASATAGASAWNDITGKPSTFTPSAHNHAASEITSGTLDAARLPATTVTAGAYGGASSVGTFTVDSAGRLTSAGSTNIAIAAGAVSGLASIATSGSASDLSAGTVPIARLPTGTTSTTVAIGNHTHAASDIASGVIATARLASSGTASATTFLRGDQTWATAGSTNASDLTQGTLANARMTTRARASMNLYLWSAFR